MICSRCSPEQHSKGYYSVTLGINLKGHTFPEFVEHVLEEYNKSDCYRSYNVPCLTIDAHWRPYNARCSYCDIPYSVIGRIETFEEDVKYIIFRQNLTHLISWEGSQLHAHNTGR